MSDRLRHGVTLRRPQVEAAVVRVLDTLPDDEEPALRVVGTAAALLHGVDMPTGDVDLLFRTRRDVDRIVAALRGMPVLHGPEFIPGSGQYFCELDLDGVPVELSTVELGTGAPALECAGVGPWQHSATVRVRDRDVDVVAFELRLATEVARDRRDRLRPLLLHVEQHGCDVGLLRVALASHGVGGARAAAVLARCAAAGRS